MAGLYLGEEPFSGSCWLVSSESVSMTRAFRYRANSQAQLQRYAYVNLIYKVRTLHPPQGVSQLLSDSSCASSERRRLRSCESAARGSGRLDRGGGRNLDVDRPRGDPVARRPHQERAQHPPLLDRAGAVPELHLRAAVQRELRPSRRAAAWPWSPGAERWAAAPPPPGAPSRARAATRPRSPGRPPGAPSAGCGTPAPAPRAGKHHAVRRHQGEPPARDGHPSHRRPLLYGDRRSRRGAASPRSRSAPTGRARAGRPRASRTSTRRSCRR